MEGDEKLRKGEGEAKRKEILWLNVEVKNRMNAWSPVYFHKWVLRLQGLFPALSRRPELQPITIDSRMVREALGIRDLGIDRYVTI